MRLPILKATNTNSNTPKTTGFTLYKGPSLIDKKPIVVIATGVVGASQNSKTGDLIQTWVLLQKMSPVDAVRESRDTSICGDCKHAVWNTCYVNVAQGPRSVWAAYTRGRYPKITTNDYALFKGRNVRLGAYGDPAAVPTEVWKKLCDSADGHTGYTHQWKICDPKLKNYCMASVDTEKEFKQARKKNWRTFRVREANTPLLDKEFECPASKEQNYRLKCEDCLACDGGRFDGKGTVSIVVHGLDWKSKRFIDNINNVSNVG